MAAHRYSDLRIGQPANYLHFRVGWRQSLLHTPEVAVFHSGEGEEIPRDGMEGDSENKV